MFIVGNLIKHFIHVILAGNMKESNRKELRHTFFHLFTLDVSVFPVTHDVYKRSKKHT